MQKRTIQEYLLLAICAFTALGIVPFVIYRLNQGDYLTALIDTAIIVGLLGVFALVYKTRKVEQASYFLATVTLVGITSIVFIKGHNHVYWIFPSIVACFYLFPIVRALFTSLVFCFFILTLTYHQYPIDVLFTIVVTLLITSGFAYVFAQNMKMQNQKMKEAEQNTRLRNQTLELMVSSKSIFDVLKSITQSVESQHSDMLCSILLLDDSGKYLVTGAAPSLPDFYNKAINGVQIGEQVGSCGAAAFTAKRVIVEDIDSHPNWKNYLELTQQAELASCWSEPIKNADGDVLGTFAIYKKVPSKPSAKDLELIEQFAHLASIAIERENANQIIWHQANFDSLTGLPNRNMMVEHLKQAIKLADRRKQKIGIAFIDLDHFKDINDNLGHAVGDDLLVEVAQRIQSCIRRNDTVARLGGDEFVIIFPEFIDIAGATKVSQTLLSALSEPYLLNNQTIQTSASMGMTVYPDDATSIENLLKNADQAMYCAKSAGRNGCYFFTEQMRDLTSNRIELINDLRVAISENQFFAVYQPIVDLKTGEIVKAEALIRWLHPEKGLISPLEFIPLAEETGLVIEISNLLFAEVIAQLKIWQRSYPDFQLSINTSPIQYNKVNGNIERWLEVIEENQIESATIAMEITENLLMESHSDIESVLSDVRNSNVNIAIDDFGTGYSSFSYLKEYKTDFLKIDKSFVQQMTQGTKDLVLCEAIIVMANKLGIKVIAEGIETEEQKALLAKLSCDYGQGYFFSKPVGYQEFTALLHGSKN